MTRRPRLSAWLSYEDFQVEVFLYMALAYWSDWLEVPITEQPELRGYQTARSINSTKIWKWLQPFHENNANANQVKRWLDKMADDGLLSRRSWGRPLPYTVTEAAWNSPTCRKAVENINISTAFVTTNPLFYGETIRARCQGRGLGLPSRVHVRIRTRNPKDFELSQSSRRSGQRVTNEAVYRVQ